ncbi:MAG: TonB-dependent receptor [Elusimicrobiaceae bacterium]|nr:TonB-dependent receptor [Elusimicrobiaceae bacterium]
MRLYIPAAAALLLLSQCVSSQEYAAQVPAESGNGLSVPLMQKPVAPPSKSVFELGEIASQSGAAKQSAVYSSAEIGSKELLEDNVKSVSDALLKVTGFSETRTSRGEQSFYLRGASQLQVPVMFDGVPVYVPYGDIIDTNKLPVSNVSKIQVSKGLSSVLNGPNTMGGVVNVITAKPRGKLELFADGSFAGETDRAGSAGAGTRQDRFYAAVSADYADSKGFALSNGFTPAGSQTSSGIRQNSGYIRRNYSGKLGLVPSENHEYAFAVNCVDANYQVPANLYNPRYWRFSEWKKNTYYAVGSSSFGMVNVGSRFYYDSYYNVLDSYDNATYTTQNTRKAFHSTYDDYSWGGGIVPSVTLLDGLTELGAAFSYKKDIHRSQDTAGAAWERYEAQTLSLGLENNWKPHNGLTALIGASCDIQDPLYSNGGFVRGSDTAFNPQAGVKYSLDEDTEFYASAGIKSRFPTLKELYSGYIDTKIPNPNLQKEVSHNYEAGARLFAPGLKTAVEASVFYNPVRDLIDSVVLSSSASQMQNIGKAEFKGVEMSVKSALPGSNETDIGYTYLHARNTTPGAESDKLRDRPAHRFYASDLWKINGKFELFAKLSAFSSRYVQDAAGGWVTLGGFCTVDANISYHVTADLLLRAGGTNLLDRNYFTDYGAPAPGRTLYARAGLAF